MRSVLQLASLVVAAAALLAFGGKRDALRPAIDDSSSEGALGDDADDARRIDRRGRGAGVARRCGRRGRGLGGRRPGGSALARGARRGKAQASRGLSVDDGACGQLLHRPLRGPEPARRQAARDAVGQRRQRVVPGAPQAPLHRGRVDRRLPGRRAADVSLRQRARRRSLQRRQGVAKGRRGAPRQVAVAGGEGPREGALPGHAERLEAQVRLRGGRARHDRQRRGVGRSHSRARQRVPVSSSSAATGPAATAGASRRATRRTTPTAQSSASTRQASAAAATPPAPRSSASGSRADARTRIEHVARTRRTSTPTRTRTSVRARRAEDVSARENEEEHGKPSTRTRRGNEHATGPAVALRPLKKLHRASVRRVCRYEPLSRR